MPLEPLEDDETVYRRIPRWDGFFSPPDHVTTANFKLRPQEVGLSVYKASVRTPESVVVGIGSLATSFLLRAKVRNIRGLQNTAHEALNLDVVEVPVEDDPGHAEIRKTPSGSKITPSAAKALRDLFVKCLADADWNFGPGD